MRRPALMGLLLFGVVALAARAGQYGQLQQAAPQNIFHVKYISEGAVYLDAGRNAGLEEGMILHLVHADPNAGATDSVRFQGVEPIADVRIFSVADSSAAAQIVKSHEDLVVGDIAYLDVQSIQAREDKVNAADSENYPVVVTFSYGDPLDEEIRATTVSEKTGNSDGTQVRGRFGFDTGYVSEPGGINSKQLGMLIDADISRIGGTHWNFTGYWRGDLTTQSSGNQGGVPPVTLSDLLNRTYHLGRPFQISWLRLRAAGFLAWCGSFLGILATSKPELEHAIRTARRQASLSKRILFLSRTKQVFNLWHVIHRPFSYSFAILAILHIAVALGMGYR